MGERRHTEGRDSRRQRRQAPLRIPKRQSQQATKKASPRRTSERHPLSFHVKHLPLMLTNSDNRHLRRCTCFSRIFFRRLFNLINHNQRSSHISARKLELDLIRYFSAKKIDCFLCRFNFRLRFFCLIRNDFTVFFYIRKTQLRKR